ncbi:hypothetical protein ACHHYP_17246 [Achlya hypogyna]|uniref:Tc1-like transposase DDE domain-containing protein n=1 Tax=Achlya hypogyna TaxID=1202772 RepID=A0A1V9Y4W3_ACHHY|nr:hypothetical protein ACHHYP_17246 [Achlya hypogyna]
MYGHEVLYTPPYHPELQPIEVVWACVKNRIGRDPARNMDELGSKLVASLDLVDNATWLGALDKVKRFEDQYLETADSELMAEDDEYNDDASDGEDDTGLVGEFLGDIEV